MDAEKAGILLVDDDPGILHSTKMFLKQLFTGVSVTGDPEVMMERLKSGDIDVVLLDMNFTRGEMDGQEGLGLLRKILEMDPDLPVILITAYGEFDLAVKAIKAGAFDFLVKPWNNQRLHATILSALKFRESRRNAAISSKRARALDSDNARDYAAFLGDSMPMRRIMELIRRVGPTDADVLITGENGTGKEMAARQLHLNSARSEHVFMNVDVGSLNENLFESELFGHEKGAFTDASEQKAGRFELASGGTLFLDEIGNLDMRLQAKILSVLQNREIHRVGGSHSVPVDIRLVCATNRDLSALVREGRFREDLYYRINMFEIEIPPLRERPDDILLLANHYLDLFSARYNKSGLRLSNSLAEKLRRYAWPGNIRELKNSLERAVILASGGRITADSLFPVRPPKTKVELSRQYDLVENEKRLILEVIQKNHGNMTRSAKDLGIERTALYRRIKKYGL